MLKGYINMRRVPLNESVPSEVMTMTAKVLLRSVRADQQ